MGELVIAALATYGISALVTQYDGFGHVFLKFRNSYPKSALTCTVCLSVWVAVIFAAIFWLGWAYILSPLAFVGVVIVLERL